MKVTMKKEAKRYITVAEMPDVRAIIEYQKEDTNTAADYAEMAAQVIGGGHCSVQILEAKAEICKNCRAKNNYTETSGDLDVWITFTAVLDNGLSGIVMGGANLTDIWNITGHADTDEEIKRHMYIRMFKEVR